jgi:hypothetical protein
VRHRHRRIVEVDLAGKDRRQVKVVVPLVQHTAAVEAGTLPRKTLRFMAPSI